MKKFNTLEEEKAGKELGKDFLKHLKSQFSSVPAYFWGLFPTYAAVFKNPGAARDYDPDFPWAGIAPKVWKDFKRLSEIYPDSEARNNLIFEHNKACIENCFRLQKQWEQKTGR